MENLTLGNPNATLGTENGAEKGFHHVHQTVVVSRLLPLQDGELRIVLGAVLAVAERFAELIDRAGARR